MNVAVERTPRANLESFLPMLITLMYIYEEEEERLKKEFPEVEIIRSGRFPIKLTVVYDFMGLDKERRYRLFDFERRLLNRIEEAIKDFFGEEPLTPPFEITFVRKK